MTSTPEPDLTTLLASGRIRALSFDCYGTLIDWESGLLAAFAEPLEARALAVPDEEVLELFATAEAQVEEDAATDFVAYREVLERVLDAVGEELGFAPSPDECAEFAASVPRWPAFSDSRAALAKLAERFDLIVLSNVDADLFAGSAEQLGDPFKHAFTADRIGSYKPDPRNFAHLLEHGGHPKDAILHVAQSRYHDIAPARELGFTTCWIDRQNARAGGGATKPSTAEPHYTLPNLASLAALVE